MNYAEKLKDPRWQERRLQIMDRDNWTCQLCGDTNATLHVHHKSYKGEPWEAPDEALTTYCEHCHFLTEDSIREGIEPPVKAVKGHSHSKEIVILTAFFHNNDRIQLGVFGLNLRDRKVDKIVFIHEERLQLLHNIVQDLKMKSHGQ